MTVFLISFNIMFLIIWFLTDFKLYFFETIYKKNLNSINIDEFIFLKFDQQIFGTAFTTAGLISCPFCLNFWLAAFTSIFIGPIYLPLIYIIQIFVFLIIKKLQ